MTLRVQLKCREDPEFSGVLKAVGGCYLFIEESVTRVFFRLISNPVNETACGADLVSMSLVRLLPVYLVVFAGFVGYSMMITVFTPMFLQGYGRLIPPGTATGTETILLGLVLCMYPLGQFLSAPPIGALSDKYGRRRVLLISLVLSIFCYGLIAIAIGMESFWLLIIALLAAGLSEGNIVIAQSAVSDVSNATNRGRLFGYIYMSASLAYVVGPLVWESFSSSSSCSSSKGQRRKKNLTQRRQGAKRGRLAEGSKGFDLSSAER